MVVGTTFEPARVSVLFLVYQQRALLRRGALSCLE
jgi:hypothetical protein